MAEREAFSEKEMTAFWGEVGETLGEEIKNLKIMVLSARNIDEGIAVRFKRELVRLGARVDLISQKTLLPGQNKGSLSALFRESSAAIFIAPEYDEDAARREQGVLLQMMKDFATSGYNGYKIVAFSPEQGRQTYGFVRKVEGGYVELGSLNAGKDFALKLDEASAS